MPGERLRQGSSGTIIEPGVRGRISDVWRRARRNDALQIAVALQERCEAFLTNDRRPARVTEIRVLLIDDLEP
jgi:hypothetical protein